MTTKKLSMFDPSLVKPALVDAFRKLDVRVQLRNPVMFVVYIGSIFTTGLWFQALFGGQGEAPAWFIGVTTLWLWFTVLFANFAEALAEGRSKAQAAALRAAKKAVMAKKLREPQHDAKVDLVPGTDLRRGDVVLVEAGDMIPADGEVIEGVASVNESAITGESAPVIREAGGDFSAVTGGTTVLSDWIVVRITVNPGRDLPRPHDRAGRRREAPEDAERDRAHHPAGGADADLSARHGHAAALLAVRGGSGQGRPTGHAHRAGGAARVPDPDHHRRTAVGHRHRRHEPHARCQRHRHLRARGRGGRRRRRAAARQDRHHHPRQPPGIRVSAGARRAGAAAGRCRATGVARRRDPRGAQHRGAGQAAFQFARTRHPRARRDLRAVLGADAHERRESRGPPDPQGRDGRNPQARRGQRRQLSEGGVAGRGGCVTARQHAARGRRRHARAGRDRTQGHRQGRHQGALRANCAAWASRP